MDTGGGVGAVLWLAVIVLASVAFYRAKKRRKHIGSGAAAFYYDILQEDKRKAIDIIAEQKTAARDFEHAEDDKEKRRDR